MKRLPADLVTAMRALAERKARDAATVTDLAAGGSGQLHEIYSSNAEVARAEARAYAEICRCIYALVVLAPVDVLLRLAGHRGVRAVDAAPDVGDPDVGDLAGTVFVAPLPEQRDRVEPPPDDGLPDAAPTDGPS